MTQAAGASDRPSIGTVLDVTPASLPDTFMCWVEEVGDEWLVVSAPRDRSLQPVNLAVGERMDLVWRGSGELQSLPAFLAAVETGERPRWRLEYAGVAKRGQRRDAVRAPITVPIRLGPEPGVPGTTVDLSEGGLRCVLHKQALGARHTGVDRPDRAAGLSLEVGQVIRMTMTLPEITLTCLSEITRRFPRDEGQAELSVRFIGLTDHEQDVIRRRVFSRLRDLRRRGLL